MDLLDKISKKLGDLASALAGIILIYIVLHIICEIILRVFFSSSTYILDEFVTYGVSGITFLCMAKSMRNGTIIRVGIVLEKLSGSSRSVLEAIGLFATLILSWYIIYFFGANVFWRDIVRGRISGSIAEVPLWIPESLVLIGLIIFSLQVFTMLMKILIHGMDKSEEIIRAD